MTVRDDRGDVKQTTAGFRGPLMVQSLTSAKSKFLSLNEADLLTCLANDFGYENWIARALDYYADPGDVVVLISSSGESTNILEGAKKARELGLTLLTFLFFL